MSSKSSDKLAKLAGFGMLAGSEPAASAREVMKASEPKPTAVPPAQEPIAATTQPESIPEPTKPAKPSPKAGEGSEAVKSKPKTFPVPLKDNLTRNVVFLPDDQTELDRIEDLLRAAGIRKPTIADLVRVALRAAKPNPEEAAAIYRDAKALDARRAENKGKRLVK